MVFLDVTVSLDGFIAGPKVSSENAMGEGGDALHDWIRGSETDRELTTELFEGTGAFIMGRRTFDVGLQHWGDDGAFHRPCFVMTHRERPRQVVGPTTFDFVVGDAATVLEQARRAAGAQAICIMGGGSAALPFLTAGLVDEFRLHVAPVLLGRGTRLFDGLDHLIRLNATQVRTTPSAAHVRYVRP